MLQKLFSWGGKCIGWLIVGFFLFMALGSFVSASPMAGVLNLIAALLCVPVNKIKNIKSKIKLNTISSFAIAFVLLLSSLFMLPQVEEAPQQIEELDTPVASVETSIKTSKQPVSIPETPKTETPVETPKQEETPAKTETPKESEAEKPKEETPTVTAPTAPIAPPVEEKPQETPVDSTFSVHYIDVGQADAALVECDGQYMLIDGGNKADSNVIYSVLKSAGASHLDMVVGTHGHEDHIGGLPGAYNYADVDLTLCSVKSYNSDAFADFAKYAGNISIPRVGDSYKLGSADVKILGVNGGSDANNSSIVLKITYGETAFLFTGDAEREAEQAILNTGADLSATVLKVGHHGSDTSTTYSFLREIMPEYAIISVGKGNSYGHPTDATLSRLRDAGVKVYRTDLNGDIKVTSDGKTVSVITQKSASNDAIMTAGSVASSKPAETTKPSTSTTTPVAPVTPPVTENKPQGYTVIANKNSKAFHRSTCSRLPKEKNRVYFNSREAAMAAGYNNPCDYCNP